MKKFIVFLLFCCFATTTISAQQAETQSHFEIHGSSLGLLGDSSLNVLGQLSFGYNFNKPIGLTLNGIMSTFENKSIKTWGSTLTVSILSHAGDRLTLKPSVGFGVVGGLWHNVDLKPKVVVDASVEMRYQIDESIFCGFQIKELAGQHFKSFLIGFTLGLSF